MFFYTQSKSRLSNLPPASCNMHSQIHEHIRKSMNLPPVPLCHTSSSCLRRQRHHILSAVEEKKRAIVVQREEVLTHRRSSLGAEVLTLTERSSDSS